MTTSPPLPPPAATKSHAVVEGRLAKLEAKLAETQAELIALKSIERNNLRGEHFAKKATTPMAKAAPAATGDEEDVVAMAVHLGLDVSCTKEMSAQQRWLVEKALDAPIPEGWVEHVDGDGVNFFFNTTDGTSSWDHPLDFYFRNMLKESVAAPKTVHSDAGNAGANMSLTDVIAAGCDIIALSTQQHKGKSGDDEAAARMRVAGTKRGVDTSAGQMMAYARHLGVDLTQDLDLLWIAEQALNAPTPEGWREHFAEDGSVYYSNEETGLKTYSHPLDDHYRELYKRSREVKLLSSKKARKTSLANAQHKQTPVNLAVKVIESLNNGNGEEENDAAREKQMREDMATRRFGTDLASNVAVNQPAPTPAVAVAAAKDALDRRERCVIPVSSSAAASTATATKIGPYGLPVDAEGVGFNTAKEKEAPPPARVVDKENDALDNRQRCVIPVAKAKTKANPAPAAAANAVDEKVGHFGLPANAEGVGYKKASADDRLDHRERCVIPAAAAAAAAAAQEKEAPPAEKSEAEAEADELAEVMRLSAEEADNARTQREAEDKTEAEAVAEALKLSADLAEAMKASAAQADEERAAREAEDAAEAEIIKLSVEEAEARRQQDAFAFEEEQRNIARAALESAIAEQKAEAARRAAEEKLEAERVEKARAAAEEAERVRVAAESEKAARLALEAKEAALEAEAMKLSAEEAERVRTALETEAAQTDDAIKLSMEEAEARRQREAFAFEEYQSAMSKALLASAEAEQTAEAARKAEEIRAKAEEEEKVRVAAEEAEKVRVAAEEAEKAKAAAAEAEKAKAAAEKANEARRARRALEVAEAEAEAEAIRLSIAEAKAHEKLHDEEENALTRATTASLAEQKAVNDKKAQELVPSLLFGGIVR